MNEFMPGNDSILVAFEPTPETARVDNAISFSSNVVNYFKEFFRSSAVVRYELFDLYGFFSKYPMPEGEEGA